MHSLAALKLLALGLSMNWDAELQRLELLRAIGPEHAARLDIVYPDANPTDPRRRRSALRGAPTAGSQLLGMFREAARWIPTAGGMSNSWVVSGERIGRPARPILCNDPHLVPGMPSIWYAAHIQAGEDFEFDRASRCPGCPSCSSATTSGWRGDSRTPSPTARTSSSRSSTRRPGERFRTERGFEPTRRLREIIHVKNSSDVLEEVVITRHGPVVERIEDPERSIWRGLALQWTALQPGGGAEGLLRLQRAGDWKSFREAFVPFDAPSQNVVYADVDGHIGYLLSGRVPVRKSKPSGLPVQGWTGDAVWKRYLTPDEMPTCSIHRSSRSSPPTTASSATGFPYYIGADYMSGLPRAAPRRAAVGAGGRPRVHGTRADGPGLPAGSRGGPAARRDALHERRRRERAAPAGAVGRRDGSAPRRADHLRGVHGPPRRALVEPGLRQRVADPRRRRPLPPGLPVPRQPRGPAHAVAHRAVGARRRRAVRGADDVVGGDQQVARGCDDRPAQPPRAQVATLVVGSRPPARAHPRVRTAPRPRRPVQRPLDPRGRQHRHRARDVPGARAGLRDPPLGAVVATGARRREVGRVRGHPRARSVRSARIAALPRSLAPLAHQPAVPPLLERPGVAPPCPRAPDDLSGAGGARRSPGGRASGG